MLCLSLIQVLEIVFLTFFRNSCREMNFVVVILFRTSENIFSHLYISYTTNERLQGVEQFHSKNYVLEMPCSLTKMGLTIA